jgi:phage I-like protein
MAETETTDPAETAEAEATDQWLSEPDGVLVAEQLTEDTLALGFDMPAGEPPQLFRLFPQGTTRTTKGDLLFDEQSATDVMAAMADHGKSDLPIDYQHGMLALLRTPDSGKAAGWFKPAIIKGELWASDVQWTPSADKALRAREYRYHSPAVKFDRETRRVTKLINVALTNLHATKGLKPLVASETTTSAPGSGATEAPTMSEKLFARLGAKDEAEAIIMLAEHESWTKGVLATLSCTKLDEAVPAIEQLQAQAGESVKLAEKIVTLTAERDALTEADAERKQKALIAELSEAGKLPPSLHDWAQTISYEQLSEFGEKAEPSAKAEATTPKPAAGADPEVTEQMRATAKQMGVSVDDIKATIKAREAE